MVVLLWQVKVITSFTTQTWILTHDLLPSHQSNWYSSCTWPFIYKGGEVLIQSFLFCLNGQWAPPCKFCWLLICNPNNSSLERRRNKIERPASGLRLHLFLYCEGWNWNSSSSFFQCTCQIQLKRLRGEDSVNTSTFCLSLLLHSSSRPVAFLLSISPQLPKPMPISLSFSPSLRLHLTCSS